MTAARIGVFLSSSKIGSCSELPGKGIGGNDRVANNGDG